MSAISKTDVEHVAKLARLALSPKELETLAAQLDAIVQYVRQLQSVPTQGVEPTSHALPLSNVQRPDANTPSLSQRLVCDLAPASQPPFVKVPKVIES